MALKDTETPRILKRGIPTKDKSFISSKSKLNEFGENNPKNPYHTNSSDKPTQLLDTVDKKGRSGGVKTNIRTFVKGLKMFGVDIPVGDRYEDTIIRDSQIYGLSRKNVFSQINRVSRGFKRFKKSVKSFSDNPLKSISDMVNVDQDVKLAEYNAKAYGKHKKLGNPAAKIMITNRALAKSFQGPIKGGKKSRNVNRANMTPYGEEGKGTDLIPLRFYDEHNKKHITFSALLSGITDTIAPEYATERYLGRPDSVYVYQGVGRSIGFSFDVYPTTRQELPVLWEKVNYLVGMCYPNWVDAPKPDPKFNPLTMISPICELTIGDMYKDTPGYLSGVTLTVQDGSTWEIEKNLELPHHIQIAIEFQYIGKYLPNAKGKHFELNWLYDKNNKLGTFPEEPADKTKRQQEIDKGFTDRAKKAEGKGRTKRAARIQKRHDRWSTAQGLDT